MKKVLIAGGAGFLGAHLCERLLSRGYHVTCLDNYYTGFKRNIEKLLEVDRFELLEQSVSDPVSGRYDEIFNLACPASPPHYQMDPIYTFKTSVMGTLNLLELADRCGAKFFQASTSEIYGDPAVHPQTEDYWGNVNPIGIRSCYDEGKRAAETLIYDFHRARGTRVRVVRIFNTYGPGMNPDDGRVVSNFIIQALRGEDITIYGDGSQTRSFCYRDDLVDGIMRLMDAPDEVSFPVNIGNPVEFTIRQLAEAVLRKIPSRSRLVSRPLPQDDPTQRRPDISRARRYLGWEPKVSLDEGLAMTIRYFRERLSTESIAPAHERRQNLAH
jgi:UDP-glucuronate decarboxylase